MHNNDLCLNIEQSDELASEASNGSSDAVFAGVRPDYFDGFDPQREVDRRRKPDGRRTFEVSKMWEVHNEIARRLLLGQKASRIAEDLEVSRAMVSYVRNSRVVQDKLELMAGARDAETVDLAKEIRERAPEALQLLQKIIEGSIDAPITTRAREANNWLDRAGYSAVRRVEGQFAHAHFTAEEIEDIKRRAVENGFARPSVKSAVNVTPAEHDGR